MTVCITAAPIVESLVGTVVANVDTEELRCTHTRIQPTIEGQGHRLMCGQVNRRCKGQETDRASLSLCNNVAGTFTGNSCICFKRSSFPLRCTPPVKAILKRIQKEVRRILCFLCCARRSNGEPPGIQNTGITAFIVTDTEVPDASCCLSLQGIGCKRSCKVVVRVNTFRDTIMQRRHHTTRSHQINLQITLERVGDIDLDGDRTHRHVVWHGDLTDDALFAWGCPQGPCAATQKRTSANQSPSPGQPA